MSTMMEREIAKDLQQELKTDFPNAKLTAPKPLQGEVVSRPTREAVLVRMDHALHKLDRLCMALEQAAADVEKQLGAIKGRL
jgi:hypothetical protein